MLRVSYLQPVLAWCALYWLALCGLLFSLHHHLLALLPIVSSLLPLHPSISCQSPLSQMLGGLDWSFAGSSLWHPGGGASISQMFGCIFIQGFMIVKRADSYWQGEGRGGFRWTDWRDLFLHGLFPALLDSSYLSFSHSSSSSSLSQFWIMFRRVWLERGDAPGGCKSGEGCCWHSGGR